MQKFLMTIDQGTTSTHAMLFNHSGKVLSFKQKEHEQFYPKPGWVEHDPVEIWSAPQIILLDLLNENGLTTENLEATGIIIQYETTFVWSCENSEPYQPAKIDTSAEIEILTGQVNDTSGIYFIPAFSGLFVFNWCSDVNGAIVGLHPIIRREHIARAGPEATAYQTRDLLDGMAQDAEVQMKALNVNGGMVVNNCLMQLQADLQNWTVIRPVVAEMIRLGEAYAAGLVVGFWDDVETFRKNWQNNTCSPPILDELQRQKLYIGWEESVTGIFDWVEGGR